MWFRAYTKRQSLKILFGINHPHYHPHTIMNGSKKIKMRFSVYTRTKRLKNFFGISYPLYHPHCYPHAIIKWSKKIKLGFSAYKTTKGLYIFFSISHQPHCHPHFIIQGEDLDLDKKKSLDAEVVIPWAVVFNLYKFYF